ncbi:MAG TPA: GFA family protein [Candidatus Binatia bacterium]|jgi:hypothetical protein|nr:GFA family protein [Candidatus Binatia bacterium]
MSTLRGSCHCGLVRFEVTGPLGDIVECNCSICTRKGYLHWIVPQDAFRLLEGEDALVTYRFGTGVAQHRFCGTCGVSSFYVPRSHPDRIDVNVRCLDDVDPTAIRLRPFDGRKWDDSIAARQLEPSEETE